MLMSCSCCSLWLLADVNVSTEDMFIKLTSGLIISLMVTDQFLQKKSLIHGDVASEFLSFCRVLSFAMVVE